MLTPSVSAEEKSRLQTDADKAKLSLAEYVRTKALAPAQTTDSGIEETLRYLLYMVESLHLSTYLIAEKSAVLYPEQLQEILQNAIGQATLYVHQMEQNFARLRDQLSAVAKGEAQGNG